MSEIRDVDDLRGMLPDEILAALAAERARADRAEQALRGVRQWQDRDGSPCWCRPVFDLVDTGHSQPCQQARAILQAADQRGGEVGE